MRSNLAHNERIHPECREYCRGVTIRKIGQKLAIKVMLPSAKFHDIRTKFVLLALKVLFERYKDLVWYFRALGCKIGKNVCLYPTGGDPMMTEPDLVMIGM